MIQIRTHLDVADNTGARIAWAIGVLGHQKRYARIGDVIALEGGLGAGKTTLARGILEGLGLQGEAPSPSFTLVQSYAPPEVRLPVWHVDLYRLSHPEEAEELGLDGAFFRVHHFARQQASPFPLLSAIAARTSRIEIGTGVIDMRYETPLYMAEEAAATDLISGGRLRRKELN